MSQPAPSLPNGPAPQEPGGQPMPAAGMPESGPPAEAIDISPLPRVTIHTFAETPEFAGTWAQIASDRRMVAVTNDLNQGGIQTAIERYRAENTPNLIIVETKAGQDQLSLEIDMLAEVCDTDTQVLVVGHCNDIQLYRHMVQLGVANYLVFPVSVSDLLTSISDLYNEPGAEKIGRTSAVIGASGGAGASTVAQNLALQLATVGDRDILLVDMDLGFGSASLNLDLEANQGLAEIIDQAERLDAGILDRVLLKRGTHLNVLTTTGGLETDRQFDAFSVERLIETASRHIPVVVLDIPHVWSDWTQRALTAADDVVVVAEPQLCSLRNAATLLRRLTALRPNDSPPQLILNRVGMPRRDEIPRRDVVNLLKLTPTAEIPYDAKGFGMAAGSGKLVVEVAARRPAGKAIAQLTEELYPTRTLSADKGRRRTRWRR